MTKKRVLVVDDDETIRSLVLYSLSEEGYEVFLARNGLDALKLMESHPVDMILLDMRMPVMSGWEFADALRTKPAGAPPIVAFTAAVDAADRAHEIKADGYLAKPFDLDELSDIVRKTIGPAAPPAP